MFSWLIDRKIVLKTLIIFEPKLIICDDTNPLRKASFVTIRLPNSVCYFHRTSAMSLLYECVNTLIAGTNLHSCLICVKAFDSIKTVLRGIVCFATRTVFFGWVVTAS